MRNLLNQNRPLLLLLCLLATSLSCSSQPGDSAGKAPAAGALSEVKPIDSDGFAALLASHRGKVILVDFWATWCPPCVAEFPNTVRLHRKYPEIVTIGVAMDNPDDLQKVKDFYREQEVDFGAYISELGDSVPEDSLLQPGVPIYQLYDTAGKLYLQTMDAEEVEPKLQELLQAKDAPAAAAGA
ncbi:TlpA family protein disulfide reductase [Lignipirellula cremea]|uniref:Thiol:disulfide interchange protein TlpA n=1 Tax=Lignipirellula cremea TaxID=2528010 RepID=A0A518DYJ2_9BACT|nr:TlpA disulfide reductase family protein [Lignipirellula cremea]QDU96865.1 Thiol:disulfide interchange protein TlpA [Lignipirellula cremea]